MLLVWYYRSIPVSGKADMFMSNCFIDCVAPVAKWTLYTQSSPTSPSEEAPQIPDLMTWAVVRVGVTIIPDTEEKAFFFITLINETPFYCMHTEQIILYEYTLIREGDNPEMISLK